ncbi:MULTISPECIES: hypothetical protein [unclassified Paenibacillus]|uniref:hypothetical protein n=1 Tax=unclassified Paenibacillus TaxID=185978 RepID=UPI001C0FF742|nr:MULTISPECIES: hypothetical protein [unclassified Paenibacillus]MBU5442018.1 hypothetical protein [Paenibacillus sp. MSJ-34]CAH0120450.1 hypothetical protein PAE9249_02969 [Paenibacillus sp. CECT 9249]
MITAIKIFFLIIGILLLNWLYVKLRQEKGDERMKRIAHSAGFGTWSFIVIWAGVKTLLQIVNIDFSFLGNAGSISIPALLGTSIAVYVILFAYHYWKKS